SVSQVGWLVTSIWKQRQAVSASVATLIGRIIIADYADLFGGDLQTCSILPPVILNQAVAIGYGDSVGFVLRLRIRDHISELFARARLDAVGASVRGRRARPASRRLIPRSRGSRPAR